MNDRQILRGLKKGTEASMNYAIDKYAKLMWHIAGTVMKNVASSEDIEECVADVFVCLWQNHDKFDEQRGSLKVWLAMVAKSKAIDKYRQLSKRDEVSLYEDLLIETMGVMEDVLSAELRRELVAAIQALGEPDREIVIRRFYYQQKPKEIGFVLDLPVKQVENRLYRSKLKLRDMITCENGGY